MSLISKPSGEADGPTPVAEPRWDPSTVVIGLMGLLIVIVMVSAPAGDGWPGPTILNLSLPGSLVALAMMLTHNVGRINLAVGGIYGLVLVLIGRAATPNDFMVLAVVALGLLVALGVGRLVELIPEGGLGSLIVFFALQGLTLAIGGGTSRSADLSDSWILRALGSRIDDVPIGAPVMAAVLVVAVMFLLESGVGRRIRALGADRERALLSESFPAVPLAVTSLAVGLLVSMGALMSFARLGTVGSSDEVALLLDPLVAFIIGNGGLRRRPAAPARVLVAYLLLDLLENELILTGLSSINTSLVAGTLAILTIGLSHIHQRPARA